MSFFWRTSFGFAVLLLLMPLSYAQEAIQTSMQSNVPITDDFTVGPTKFTMQLAPGEEATVVVEVQSRQRPPARFSISTEDFSADTTEKQSTILYGLENGPFPARAWLQPTVLDFTLQHGENARIPVKVKVSPNAEPGDHYAALLVQRERDPNAADKGLNIISRVGSLFIIQVKGDVVEQGKLTGISTDKTVNGRLPIALHVTAENTGTIYMLPAGTVDIRNALGFMVDRLPLKDWTVLRQSRRTISLVWQPRFALGYYTATTNLEMFGKTTAPVTTGFWVLPLIPIILLLLLLSVVSFFMKRVFSRFEIRRKGGSPES